MKLISSFAGVVALLLILVTHTFAQSLEERISRKVRDKANRKVDKTIDKGLDKVEDGIDNGLKGEGSSKKKEAPTSGNEKRSPAGPEKRSEQVSKKESGVGGSTDFSVYSKFDFMPGEKLIVYEDFSQDAVGDFPAKWNTNASAEIVTIANSEGHWLALTTSGIVTPDFIDHLPENFTLEFDLATTPKYDYYDSWFGINLLSADKKEEVINWNAYRRRRTGIEVSLHPQDASSGALGRSKYAVYNQGGTTVQNAVSGMAAFNAKTKTMVRISIWRQDKRLRVYVNESKIWDLPRAFDKEKKYNTLVFARENAKLGNNYFIKGLRLAVGNPDTRSKLLTEGKFTTTGIYFNTNAADIKPESYAVLKEIAEVLAENPEIKVRIVGHTDSDGDDQSNLALSGKRAESVKQSLVRDFGIKEGQLQTDGKGEREPISDNATPAGKASNRRVEFIKL